MARTCRPFTALDIKQCATGTYAVGGATGLYFRKNKSQSLFFLRYTDETGRHVLSLGQYPSLTLVKAREEANRLMNLVGIDERLRQSFPHELDGGRRQRVGIARALALQPDFVVCDEPVSALDVSIQAQVLNLLMDLQEQLGMAYMFVTHDLSVVRHIADDILVMYLGQSVEKAPAEQLFRKALHPYTKALLSAIPSTDIHRPMQRIQLKGEITSPINPEPGCRFAARCPYAEEGCRQPQELVEVLPDHFVKCCRCREINGI